MVRFYRARDLLLVAVYPEISAWYIKLNTMKLRAEIFAFFPYCTVMQQPSRSLFLKQRIN